MSSKWWKVTDEDLLGFLKAKEVKADLNTFYIGEMVDVIVDGKQMKRRCFDTPSGNTINIKGYRVCYDDFDEPVEEIESKLNKRGITTMQMDWNTIKNNRIIKSSLEEEIKKELEEQHLKLNPDGDTPDISSAVPCCSGSPGSHYPYGQPVPAYSPPSPHASSSAQPRRAGAPAACICVPDGHPERRRGRSRRLPS